MYVVLVYRTALDKTCAFGPIESGEEAADLVLRLEREYGSAVKAGAVEVSSPDDVATVLASSG